MQKESATDEQSAKILLLFLIDTIDSEFAPINENQYLLCRHQVYFYITGTYNYEVYVGITSMNEVRRLADIINEVMG